MVRRPRASCSSRRALAGPIVATLVLSVASAPVLLRALPAAAVCGPTPAAVPSGAASDAAVAAVAWLVTQQQSDGGFEVAGYPGFETPDAILAVAEAAQTGTAWSTAEALAAVSALTACGPSPLDAVDDFAEDGLDAGTAAKLVVLVAAPLGIPAAAFDPSGDGGAVDLVAIVADGAAPDGSYGTFNDTLYAALATRLVPGTVPPPTVARIRTGQHPDGGWDYTGDLTTGTPADVNTSAAAILALVAGGAARTDPAVVNGLGFLAARQQTDGGWQEDGDGQTNPNATALAALAIRTAGYDPDGSAWRPATPAGAASVAAVTGTPTEALLAIQDPDGHLVGPYDSFGLNTFGTSQGVRGLLRSWLVGALPLATPATTTTVPAPTPTTAAVAARLANSGAGGATTSAVLGVLALSAGAALLATRRRLA
ncbi:MAG: prenyltransferase/squalene oxidase repeat-containing protein [Actinomycetes bacterium]